MEITPKQPTLEVIGKEGNYLAIGSPIAKFQLTENEAWILAIKLLMAIKGEAA